MIEDPFFRQVYENIHRQKLERSRWKWDPQQQQTMLYQEDVSLLVKDQVKKEEGDRMLSVRGGLADLE